MSVQESHIPTLGKNSHTYDGNTPPADAEKRENAAQETADSVFGQIGKVLLGAVFAASAASYGLNEYLESQATNWIMTAAEGACAPRTEPSPPMTSKVLANSVKVDCLLEVAEMAREADRNDAFEARDWIIYEDKQGHKNFNAVAAYIAGHRPGQNLNDKVTKHYENLNAIDEAYASLKNDIQDSIIALDKKIPRDGIDVRITLVYPLHTIFSEDDKDVGKYAVGFEVTLPYGRGGMSYNKTGGDGLHTWGPIPSERVDSLDGTTPPDETQSAVFLDAQLARSVVAAAHASLENLSAKQLNVLHVFSGKGYTNDTILETAKKAINNPPSFMADIPSLGNGSQ